MVETTLLDAVKQIEDRAKTSDQTLRVIKTMKVGQAVRQGDIYLVKVQKELTKQNYPLNVRQLVPGNTLGSRHCAEAPAQLFESDNTPIPGIAATALRGPIVVSPDQFTVSHPDHAHVSLPGGTYQVLFQLDFLMQQRVQD